LTKAFPEGVGTTPQEYTQTGVWPGFSRRNGRLLRSTLKQEFGHAFPEEMGRLFRSTPKQELGNAFPKQLVGLLRSTYKQDLAKVFPEGVGTTPQVYTQTGVGQCLSEAVGRTPREYIQTGFSKGLSRRSGNDSSGIQTKRSCVLGRLWPMAMAKAFQKSYQINYINLKPIGKILP
jgi:hypothetical protein